jgi:hypothetical protein
MSVPYQILSSSDACPHGVVLTRRQLASAALDLKFSDWKVVASDVDGLKVEAVGGPVFEACRRQALPPIGDDLAEVAQAIVVRAAILLTAGVTRRQLESFTYLADPSFDQDRRDQLALECCRGFVTKRIEDLIAHGDTLANGMCVSGVEAILEAAMPGLTRDWVIAEPTSPQAQASEQPVISSGSTSTHRRLKPKPQRSDRIEPSREELRRAMKYVLSTSMKLQLVVVTADPLHIAFAPGKGYGTRFDACLAGTSANDEKGRANSLVLKTLVEIVRQADADGLRAWLPEVDLDLANDPDLETRVMCAIYAELVRRVSQVLDSSGASGLALFAETPFEHPELFDL